ncbi:hypothetical protein ANT_16470 [Candidatus Moduliflexus flocculans]|uniref:Uncharacterized protein n=1 Tax=Candidatus Moduliflexus flocculans TaxID=1499966 RepID=A0A081BQ43_9BACT|nr:hypothetical protein ANT_16470 [Candidatus Moduliflexus flocculans]
MRRFFQFYLIAALLGLLGWLFGFWSFGEMLDVHLSLFALLFAGFVLLVILGLIISVATDTQNVELLRKRLYSRIPLWNLWLRQRAARSAISLLNLQPTPHAAELVAETLCCSMLGKRLRRQIDDALTSLSDQACRDAVVGVWLNSRHRRLTEFLAQRRWIAAAPMTARVVSALQLGEIELLRQEEAAIVEGLLPACADRDPAVAAAARDLLFHLQRDEAKEALCRLVIETDAALAREAVFALKYLPRNPSQRALFLFLTEQWEQYEALDFDQQLLSAAHRAAAPELRQRIAEMLRKAGRADFLTVLVGADYVSRAREMTDAEAGIMIQMLAAQQQWPRLWKLVFEISFAHSIEVVRLLVANAWLPENTDERGLFEELRELANADISTEPEDARSALPLALPEATIRVHGRINDFAFSPTQPVLAFGTGNRKAALWNFQRGEMEEVIGGFAHSVGLVTFAPTGELFCAERSNAVDTPCNLYCCQNGVLQPVGQHAGSVTSIVILSDEQALSTGRDERIALWNYQQPACIREQSLTFWPRAAAISPDAQQIVLLHENIALFDIVDFQRKWQWWGDSVGRCAIFLPGTDSFVVGKNNGSVQAYRFASPQDEPQPRLFQAHSGRVQGMAIHAASQTLITAGAEGTLHFSNWAANQFLNSLTHQEKKCTALYASPDGAFLATGNHDNSMTLWDIRVLDVPRLFTIPLATASPDQLIAIQELAVRPEIPQHVKRSLLFMQRVLQYRFRFDIEIGDIPSIKVGEFDIEIE